jgi:ABC-type uncharacterized transport system permease subunit
VPNNSFGKRKQPLFVFALFTNSSPSIVAVTLIVTIMKVSKLLRTHGSNDRMLKDGSVRTINKTMTVLTFSIVFINLVTLLILRKSCSSRELRLGIGCYVYGTKSPSC